MISSVRSIFFGVIVAMLAVTAVSAAPVTSAQPVQAQTAAVNVQYGYGYGYRYSYRSCDELRRACEYKDRLGEWGQGNCRRYQEQCGRGPSYCERLRRACLYKEEYGQVGQGNCERYREECRGGRY